MPYASKSDPKKQAESTFSPKHPRRRIPKATRQAWRRGLNWVETRQGLFLFLTEAGVFSALLWAFTRFQDLLIVVTLLYGFHLVSAHIGVLRTERSAERGAGWSTRWLLSLILMGILFTGSLNYIVNPYGYYAPDFFDPIVLTSRREKVNLYQSMKPPPDVVILGASRSFTMPTDVIERQTGLRAFNASMHGGMARDFLGFLRFMLSEGQPPQLVIVSLTIETVFLKEIPANEPKEPLQAFIGPDENSYNKLDIYLDLLSYDQIQASARQIKTEWHGRGPSHYVFDAHGVAELYDPYPREQLVDVYLEGPWGSAIWANKVIEPVQIEYFTRFLELCQENGIAVILYSPPFHPKARKLYEQNPDFVDLNEAFMSQIATWQEEFVLQYYDFSGMQDFSDPGAMFHDAVHPTQELNRILLGKMLAELP
jgi:hypothetical protein